MNILVTGGAGYIGSHTVRLLVETGHNVVVYDNLGLGHRRAVTCPLVEGELADFHKLVETMKRHEIESVVHFAAFAAVGESVVDPGKYYRNNVAGSLSLLEAMRDCKVQRLVFSSTTATYGIPDTMPIAETESQAPINPYGWSKLMMEQMMDDFATAHGLRFAALRYFNAAGAHPSGEIGEDHTPESHLIPIVLQVALGQRDQISVFGDDYPTPDGTCIRDYIHVCDLATAHLAALEKLSELKTLHLNLGTGHGHSVLEVVEACREVTGHPIPFVVAERRPGDPPELVADSRKAQQLLGWKPRYESIREIAETAWNWHKTHPRGYATI